MRPGLFAYEQPVARAQPARGGPSSPGARSALRAAPTFGEDRERRRRAGANELGQPYCTEMSTAGRILPTSARTGWMTWLLKRSISDLSSG